MRLGSGTRVPDASVASHVHAHPRDLIDGIGLRCVDRETERAVERNAVSAARDMQPGAPLLTREPEKMLHQLPADPPAV